jgi:hypothetical protein
MRSVYISLLYLLVFVIIGCGNSGDYQRQVNEHDAQTKIVADQLKVHEQQMKKYDEQSVRMDKLLDRYEKQADRYDRILDKWEKQTVKVK